MLRLHRPALLISSLILLPLCVTASAATQHKTGIHPVEITDADLPLVTAAASSEANGAGTSAYYDVWRDKRLNKAVQREAIRHHMDPLLIHAVVAAESAGHRWARSHKGAAGPMQLMPATARRFGVTNRYDPDQAVRGGSDYLCWLINRYSGNVVLAVAAYNSGERNVDKYGAVPPFRETQNYVRKIAYRYQAFVQEYRGGTIAVSTEPKRQEPEGPSVRQAGWGSGVVASSKLYDRPGVVVFQDNLFAQRFTERSAAMQSSSAPRSLSE